MNSKMLKSYKGYEIEKSYENKADGTIDSKTIIYTAYDEEGDLVDADSKLSNLKKKIDAYL